MKKYTDFEMHNHHDIMKKEEFQYRFAVVFTILVALAVFFAIMYDHYHKPIKPQESISDNIELNKIEQYHLSEGRSIKFIEDIIGY